MKNIEKKRATFWLEEFRDQPQALTLPTDFAKPQVKNNEGHSLGFFLEEESTEKLRSLAREEETTMFVTGMALYAILLSKLCCQQDIIIGTFAEGDSFLPLRNKINGDDSFNDLLAAIKVRIMSCFENQPFTKESTSNMEYNPLVNVLFSYEKRALSAQHLVPGAETFDTETSVVRFDLALKVQETKDNLFFDFDYSTQLFSKATIQRFVEYFKKTISLVTADPSIKISDIDIVQIKEKFLMLNKFNRTKAVFPKENTIIDLFKKQVDKTPDSVAIVFGQSSLTYRDLDKSSSRLANYLLENYSIEVEDLIGIQMEASEELLIALLAVLKTGAAYVPVDPNCLEERINYIKQKSACKLTIDAELLQTFSVSQNDYQEEVPERPLSPSNLAYVIYPTDATSIPEGVMIEHQSLVNLCSWHQNQYQVNEQSRGTLYSGMATEAFSWEVYPYLISGASLYLIDKKETKEDIKELHQFLETNAISHTYLPISICQELIENDFTLNDTRILTRGDSQDLPKGGNLNICRSYGPIENNLVTTAYDLIENSNGLSPIGKPINNTCIYIVSENLRLQPLGVAGELCIAGAGLSRGYLNNEELTKEKFINNPFKENGRLFKTGDLARWLPDGNIEFLGKIKGNPFSTQLKRAWANNTNRPDDTDGTFKKRYGTNG